MTDAVKTAMKGDGWKSRKFLATMITLGVVWGTATLGWLLLERMTAAEWTTFSMWVVPLTLGVYSGGNVMEKFAVAKASNGK